MFKKISQREALHRLTNGDTYEYQYAGHLTRPDMDSITVELCKVSDAYTRRLETLAPDFIEDENVHNLRRYKRTSRGATCVWTNQSRGLGAVLDSHGTIWYLTDYGLNCICNVCECNGSVMATVLCYVKWDYVKSLLK